MRYPLFRYRLACVHIAVALVGLATSAYADLVHVIEQTEVGGVTNVVSDTTKLTGMPWATATAPTVRGQIFTHWTISTKQEFAAHDEWGRAFDAPSFMLYEDTALTAHYLPATQDSDGDGVADGYEIYWYGDLAQDAASDTDGDGLTFSQELANGTNPLTPEVDVDGPIVYGDGELQLYNPSNYVSVKICSYPEGGLFATSEEWLRPGTYVETPSCSPSNSKFAYWTLNGVAVRDEWGRAVDAFHLMMSTNMETLVAVTVDDYETRMKLYWYGRTDVAMDSDTDGDGLTFAEELANGTNPLTPENDVDGPITYAEGDLLQYNPQNLQPYTIKSDPAGALFETVDDYAPFGTFVDATAYSPNTSAFACWVLNGVEQRDEWGRAVETISLQMGTNAQVLVAKTIDDAETRQKYYWYGTSDVAMDSDTDGDGFTFAEELANGTNPLMPERDVDGPITYADTELHEANLQVYEQAMGALVGGEYVELFTSPIVSNNATSATFGDSGSYVIGGANGAAIWPVVADVSGDGLWDLIVFGDSTTNVFVNVGSLGNPEFEERTDLAEAARPWCDMNSTAKLAALSLDIAPTAALSATTNGNTLLVSDSDGRIWYYASQPSQPLNPLNFSLQHKVWGGSYAGFANGLRLAAVDWDDDGDLDCLCGTAEGKLMLLRDPKVGRPTGLVAAAGVDSVKLDWEPNGQSRVRGYRVYKATKATEGTEGTAPASPGASNDEGDSSLSSFGSFTSLSQTSLPTYRDLNLAPATYAYKVSALSRFYTAGNSTPTVTESVSTEPVTATVGGPIITIGDPVKMPDGTIQIVVSINNSMNYQAAGTSIAVPYDAANLAYQKTLPSGISEKLVYKTTTADGVATIAITSGEVAPGSGTFFTLVFYGLIDGVLMGDLDCDGDVDEDDLRILIRASSLSGRKYTDYQLKAGDFNHNGKLDKPKKSS